MMPNCPAINHGRRRPIARNAQRSITTPLTSFNDHGSAVIASTAPTAAADAPFWACHPGSAK